MGEPTHPNVQAARIAAWQAVVVAVITTAGGAITGYLAGKGTNPTVSPTNAPTQVKSDAGPWIQDTLDRLNARQSWPSDFERLLNLSRPNRWNLVVIVSGTNDIHYWYRSSSGSGPKWHVQSMPWNLASSLQPLMRQDGFVPIGFGLPGGSPDTFWYLAAVSP